MNSEALHGLINNTALLLVLGLLYDLATSGSHTKVLKKPVLGLIIGSIGIAVMSCPWLLMPGVRFDARSILLSVSGLFFGFVPTVIAAIMTAVFRIYRGGDGTSVGVAFIILSSAIGLLWRRFRPAGKPMKTSELYLFGLTVHLAIAMSLFWLPQSVKSDALKIVAVPILVVWPLGTLLLSLLMYRQTTRVRLRSELETERKLFSNIASTSPIGITMFNKKGQITYANDLATQILDLKENQLSSFTYNSPEWKITDINGHEVPDEKLPFCVVKKTGKPLYDAQHFIQWTDGRKIFLSISAAALLDVTGDVSAVIYILEDITYQKAAQDRIDKLNRIHSIQSNINQAIIRSGSIDQVLQQACKIAVQDGGFNRVSFLTRDENGQLQQIAKYENKSLASGNTYKCNELGHECPAQKAIEHSIKKVAKQPPSKSEESDVFAGLTNIGHACAAFPVIVNGKALAAMCLYSTQSDCFDDKEELQLLEKLAMDISFAWEFHTQQKLRKQAEYGLAESELRYRSLFERNHAIMLILDPASGNILDANDAACNFYGWTNNEMCSMNIADINTLSPEEVAKEMQLAKKERRNHFLFRHRLASGEIRNVEVFSGPVYFKDKEMLYSIIHDITESMEIEQQRDQMEAQLRQSQKMEAVGRLAGGVAHDINNMLTVIIGYAENSMSMLPRGSDAYQAIGEIKNAANRSARLTQQLLAFSRKQVVKPQSINLNEVVQHQSSMLRRLIGEEITLHNILGDELWNVHIDPSQVDQILANMAVNARDAISGHGEITIRTSNETIDKPFTINGLTVSSGQYVKLSVVDSGSGIAPDDIEHIFEPFYTTKPEGKGTGLGLSTIYGIVKQNSGTIQVQCGSNCGTVFDIYLPRYHGETVHTLQLDKPQIIEGKQTILVAEDERQILNLTKTMLEHYGYKVITASGAREAIEIATRTTEKIDLLLTDVIMPTMNGKQLQGEMQQIHPEIKTLFMSGHTANVIENQGILDDGISFIQKPFSMQDLASKVHDIFTSQQQESVKS